MNVEGGGADAISPAHWESPPMRRALARHDFKTVYGLLRRVGVSQRRIGRLTGQSPAEVYQIMSRGRRVQAHEVLVRIADGLGVPRGYMGLAYDEETADLLDLASASFSTEVLDRMATQDVLTHAATTTMGVAPGEIGRWWQPVDRATAPGPERIGMNDVVRIEMLTAAMWQVDNAHGGGACRDAVAAQACWAQQLLVADMDDDVRTHLFRALTDLHVLAGWSSFDVGMVEPALAHLKRALELSRAGGDWAMTAHVLFRMARVYLHSCQADEGLRLLQLGQIAAQNSGSSTTTSLICINEAWARSLLGDERQMERSISRAEFEFEFGAGDGDTPRWIGWFGAGELYAMSGVARAALPGAGTVTLELARAGLAASFVERGDEHERAQALALPVLAGVTARLGDLDATVEVSQRAIDAADRISSRRVVDWLGPLATTLADVDHPGFPDVITQINSVRGRS
ncbi:hypothetical protein [Myceligenerans halotolerans]